MTINLSLIFNQLDDPRHDVTKLYKLIEILLIGIIAVLCGAETWNNIEEYALAKEDFLRCFLELPNGIPSHGTINSASEAIDNEQFEDCFIQWVSSLAGLTKGQIVAIDGKT